MANGEITYDTRSRKSIILFIISIVVLTAIILGGALYYKQSATKSNNSKESSVKKVTPTPTNSPTPTSTKAEIDKSQYSIKILNGSGIAGEAGRARTYLEDEGYEVSTVGNADKFDYQESVLEVGKDVNEDFLAELKTFISKKYLLENAVETATGTEDVTLVIGESKAE